ncbi:MAG: DUF4864 domain-containing protein [Alphaproteobacteria bacterium]
MKALSFLVIAILAVASPAAAEDSGRRERIVRVIQQQLDAFGRDDGEAAFSHASPDIQARFGTAANFMEAVASDYAALLRPRSVTFLDVFDVKQTGGVVQRVLLTGPDGAQIMALYTMMQLESGAWRISGCLLVPAPGNPA